MSLPQLRAVMRVLLDQLDGFAEIRTHVRRPALLRVWQSVGLELSEYVLKKKREG